MALIFLSIDNVKIDIIFIFLFNFYQLDGLKSKRYSLEYKNIYSYVCIGTKVILFKKKAVIC